MTNPPHPLSGRAGVGRKELKIESSRNMKQILRVKKETRDFLFEERGRWKIKKGIRV